MFTNLFFCTVKSVNPDIAFFVPGNSVRVFLIYYMFLLNVLNIQHTRTEFPGTKNAISGLTDLTVQKKRLVNMKIYQ